MVILALVTLIGAATCTVVRTARGKGPTPPKLARLGPLAPEIEDIVREALDNLSQNPRDGLRWDRFGMICEANGLIGVARDSYASAVAMKNSEAKWWYHLASVEVRLGQVDQAVRDMRHATDLDPTSVPAFWHLGMWLLDRNEIEEAERAFSRATEIDAGDRTAWIGLARVYLQRGENARAASLLERLIGGTADRYAMQLLGMAYRRLGRVDEAESALVVGAMGQPQSADPWAEEVLGFRRGYAALLKDATAHIVAGEFEPAIRILEQLRTQKPNDVVLLAHLGQVYVAAGREADGIPLLEQAIAREPDRFEAYVDLATGYMHRNDLAKARASAERALSLNGSYGPAHETLGLVLWRGGDERAAIAAFDLAVRLDPRNARALVWMGMVQTNVGRPADALLSFQRAARTDPTAVDAWIGVANAQMSRHDLGAAQAALRHAQQLQPDRPAVRETAERLQSLQKSRNQ